MAKHMLNMIVTGSFVVSIVLGVLVHVSLSSWLEDSYQERVIQTAEMAISKFDDLADDVLSSLTEIDKLSFAHCDEAALVEMRKHLFLSDKIKDYGFVTGSQLVCTTGLGVINPPYEVSEPDYIDGSGIKIWLNQEILLFDKQKTAVVISKGRFNAVVRHSAIKDIMPQTLQSELMYVDGDTKLNIAGKPQLYYALSQASASRYYPYQHTVCSARFPYCMSVAATSADFINSNRNTLHAFAVIVILISLLSFVLAYQLITHYNSPTSRVARGFKHNNFYCLYQPIVELKTKRVIGCEVLARYQDNEGDIYPDTFIPIVKKLGQSWEFTKRILDMVKQETAQLQVSEPFKINVNFFANDISSSAALELLTYAPLDNPKLQLCVEITEDEQLNHGSSEEVLKQFSQHGYLIAIDDFGTGYSNLGQLKKFQCNTLKIDRSFVNEMEEGSVRSTLIPHIIDIANKIDAKVVAEGVENNMQHQALLDAGVMYGQGWMYGKPMSIDRLQNLITNSSPQ
ncbi:EAL domain-containing protein [Pseudoalteromonas sp. SSDWG2]|uniref:EAL domain-containing protein n=1 Tax=Pseudoalteromonas sp. SSDWG2 TaxID=3139391 RepID=UPI003BA8BC1D